MKYKGVTQVMIPWFDAEGQKNMTNLKFEGVIDRRRFYRVVIKFVKDNFGRVVSKRWVKGCPFLNQPERKIVTQGEIEQFIQRMENNEDNDQGNTDSEGTSAATAGDEVRPLSDQFNVHSA